MFLLHALASPSRLESKKYETLKHELDDMKKKLNAMSADNNRLKSNLNQLDGKDKQQRMKIDELNQQMAECLEASRAANKEKVMKRIRFNWIIKRKMKIAGSLIDVKLLRVSPSSYVCFCRLQSNLQAELDAEKQICHTKKRALQIATDELAKHHETIKLSERNVEKLKKGIDWRTLVMIRMNDDNQRNLLNVEQCGIKQN